MIRQVGKSHSIMRALQWARKHPVPNGQTLVLMAVGSLEESNKLMGELLSFGGKVSMSNKMATFDCGKVRIDVRIIRNKTHGNKLRGQEYDFAELSGLWNSPLLQVLEREILGPHGCEIGGRHGE